MGYSVVFQAVLVVFGGWWCMVILRRWRDDVDTVIHGEDMARRGVTVFYWIVTVPIALWVVSAIWGVAASVIEFVRSW